MPSLPLAVTLLAVAAASLVLLAHGRKQPAGGSQAFANLPGPDPKHHWLVVLVLALVVKDPIRRASDAPEPGVETERKHAAYGPTFKAPTPQFLGADVLYSVDPALVNAVMAKPDLFTKSPTERRFLLPIFGPGVFLAEGDTHRRMRKALARPCWSSLSPSLLVELPTADLPCSHDLLLRLPARPPAQAPSFSNASLKSLTPTFYAKAHELVERLETVADAGGDETSGPQKGAVNVALWLTRAALDLIGAAGFGFDFGALREEENEIAQAFSHTFETASRRSMFDILQLFLPPLRLIPTKISFAQQKSQAAMHEISKAIVALKTAELHASIGPDKHLRKAEFTGKSLIDVLIRANAAWDLPDSQRLSDDEVQAQLSTLTLAGQDTASTVLQWMLFVLAGDQALQDRLRDELMSLADQEPTLAQLEALPILNMFIKESLRLYPAGPFLFRCPAQDAVVPLSLPTHGRDGVDMTEVHVPKRTMILISPLLINRSERLWGPDAKEFRINRWEDGLSSDLAVNALETPYAHLETFSQGPRACIGYKFALAELRVVLHALLTSLEFTHPTPRPSYTARDYFFLRPRIKGREREGMKMLLSVRRVGHGGAASSAAA